jgi:hypothetical protein
MVTATIWSWMATAAKDALGIIGFALLAAALLFLLWWALFNGLRRWRGSRDSWIAGLWNPADLAILPFDDTALAKKMGPGVAALIRGRVDPGAAGGLQAVTGHAAVSESLAALSEISDEAKAAVSIVSVFLKTLPNRHYEASGALQVAGLKGRGISIELNNHGDQLGSKTVWAEDFGAPAGDESAYQFLAIPAAAWVEHQVAARLNNSENFPDDPEVWMLFNAGLAWQQRNDYIKARPLYEKALDIDPHDSWSMSNLGLIEVREGNFERADKLLSNALKALEGKPL